MHQLIEAVRGCRELGFTRHIGTYEDEKEEKEERRRRRRRNGAGGGGGDEGKEADGAGRE